MAGFCQPPLKIRAGIVEFFNLPNETFRFGILERFWREFKRIEKVRPKKPLSGSPIGRSNPYSGAKTEMSSGMCRPPGPHGNRASPKD